MKVLIDACVLFPTVLREIVLNYAVTGGFQPLWSMRILEEWRRAAARSGVADGVIAEGEIALVKANFAGAMVTVDPATEARLNLPDPDDAHVLAAAVDGQADELLTLNTKDFPTRTLSAEGILRRHPDEFLLEAYHADPDAMEQVVDGVLARAMSYGIDTSDRRKLLKKARLPRLAKALDRSLGGSVHKR